MRSILLSSALLLALPACMVSSFEDRAAHVLTLWEAEIGRARAALDSLRADCDKVEGLAEPAKKILAAECQSIADRLDAAETERQRLLAEPTPVEIERLSAALLLVHREISRVNQLRVFGEAAVAKGVPQP